MILSVLRSNFRFKDQCMLFSIYWFLLKINVPILVFGKRAFAFFWSNLTTKHSNTVQNCSEHLLVWKMNDSITSKWTKTVGELALSVEKKTIKTCFFTCAESQYRQIKVKLGCLSCIYVFHCYMHAYWRNHSDLIRSLWSIVFEKKIVW